MAFGEHAAWFAFTSDRFDTSSDLPEDANAGNRFYGRDVAELVANGLDGSSLDEDWGWQAHAKRPDDSVLEVSVYHDPDEVGDNEWALMVRSLRKERKLGIMRFRETEIDAAGLAALKNVFREAGVELRQAEAR